LVEVPDLGPDPLDDHGVPRAAHPQPAGGDERGDTTRAHVVLFPRTARTTGTAQAPAGPGGPGGPSEKDIAAPSEKHGDEPGLSSRRIRELASWYIERFEHYRNGCADINPQNQADLDAGLRRMLREAGVFPEFVDIEFERVMEEVFRT
jgi:hypothetical protein